MVWHLTGGNHEQKNHDRLVAEHALAARIEARQERDAQASHDNLKRSEQHVHVKVAAQAFPWHGVRYAPCGNGNSGYGGGGGRGQ